MSQVRYMYLIPPDFYQTLTGGYSSRRVLSGLVAPPTLSLISLGLVRAAARWLHTSDANAAWSALIECLYAHSTLTNYQSYHCCQYKSKAFKAFNSLWMSDCPSYVWTTNRFATWRPNLGKMCCPLSLSNIRGPYRCGTHPRQRFLCYY